MAQNCLDRHPRRRSRVIRRMPAHCLRTGSLFFLRNNGQQQVRLFVAAEMQGRNPAEDLMGTIQQIVMQERSAARELVLEVRQLASARAGIDIVLAPNSETHAVARGDYYGGRPDLDVELDYLALPERLRLVVRVIGPIGQRNLVVELAVGFSRWKPSAGMNSENSKANSRNQ